MIDNGNALEVAVTNRRQPGFLVGDNRSRALSALTEPTQCPIMANIRKKERDADAAKTASLRRIQYDPT